MSASKTLIAAIAAATIVGTVGFVSAQTTDPAAPATPTGTQPMDNPSSATPTLMPAATPMPADRTAPNSTTPSSTTPSGATAPAMTDTAPAADTLEPKADRN